MRHLGKPCGDYAGATIRNTQNSFQIGIGPLFLFYASPSLHLGRHSPNEGIILDVSFHAML